MGDGFLKAVISLFVAIDALGAIPILTSLTQNMTADQKKKLVRKAVIAAFTLGVVFTVGGQAIFDFLGITDNDFRVAGGILLLIFAVRDLVTTEDSHQGGSVPESVGIVPIAIPLIMGPAALAALMLGADTWGMTTTLGSLAVNIAFVWFVFAHAGWVMDKIGKETSKALAKIFSLLRAAIGVMLIRQGVTGMMH